MKITILTLFEKVYDEFLNSSIIKKAIDKGIVEIKIINFRKYSKDKHLNVDDYQYGGGAGMVIKLQPIVDAIESVKNNTSKIILTTPIGKTLTQATLRRLAKEKHIILIAGHYEGIDHRIEHFIDETISIGDYILTGGEIPTLVMLDGIIRLLPGVISPESLIHESFDNELLDYPVYTSPANFRGYTVPDVLLSGNHQAIAEFRQEQQISLTKKYRPDLYNKYKERNKNEN